MPKLVFGDLVSVIVPVCNSQEFLIETLDAVFEQTYQNIELILLDDGSTDAAVEMAKYWSLEKKAKDRFFHLRMEKNEEHLGLPCTINKGLSASQGKALAILNTGDLYTQKRIETFMQAAEEYQSDWLFSGIRVIDEKGGKAFSETASAIEACYDAAADSPAVGFSLLRKNMITTAGNLFFSRALFNQIGGFCNLRYCHDWDFALQSCLISEPTLINEPLYEYRIHESQTFSIDNAEKYLESQIVYRRYFEACQAGNCLNPDAPWISNWPGLFEKWIEEDQTLELAFDLVGHDRIKYDLLSNVINRSYS